MRLVRQIVRIGVDDELVRVMLAKQRLVLAETTPQLALLFLENRHGFQTFVQPQLIAESRQA